MLINPEQVTEIGTVGTEPVKLAYAKTHLRVDHAEEDILIASIIKAAREFAEYYCSRSFAQHTYRADLPGFAASITLPGRPIQTIDSIQYYDTGSPETLQTVDPAVYTLQNDRILLNPDQEWPDHATRVDAVQITYSTGYSDLASPEDPVANCPESARAAILLFVGDLYENREGQSGSRQLVENVAGPRLLKSLRVYL